MATRIHPLHVLLLACAVSACHAQERAPVQDAAAQAIIPAIVQVREAIQEVAPERKVVEPVTDRLTSDLIIKWEVSSPSFYSKKYQHPVWPGGSSGVTIGIGYDLGYATPKAVDNDWTKHPQKDVLRQASGLTGAVAKASLARFKLVVTPYPLAESVFRTSTLPSYSAATRRALGSHYDDLDEGDQAALKDLGYNRGWSMGGSRNREKRNIRDYCLPRHDSICIATELRSMKRLWPTVKGLRDRRDDEARTAEIY